MKHKNKKYVITGGNSGMGYQTAKLLVQEGAHVFICGRDHGRLNDCLSKLGDNADGMCIDVSNLNQLDDFYASIAQKFKNIDGVFANAGFALFKPAQELTPDDFDSIVSTNMKGAFFTVTKALPLLNTNSSIVFTSSTAAMKGFAGSSVYAASKASLRSFTKVLAAELASKNIRVNSISPGLIDTYGLKRNGMPDDVREEAMSKFAAMVPLKRSGDATEVASAVSFLLSEESSYINGVNLVIDGGLTQV